MSNPPPKPRPKTRVTLAILGVCLVAGLAVIILAFAGRSDTGSPPKKSPPKLPPLTFSTPAPGKIPDAPPEPPPDVQRNGETIPDPNSTAGVEYLLDHFDKGNLAFNAPTTMPLRRSQLIHLVISPTGTAEELAALIAAPGKVETAQVRVSGVMQAELVGGSAFKVEPLSPTEQLVARAEPTEWRWNVTALQGGHQTLHLTVNAIVRTGDKVERRRTLRAFDREVAVEVSWTTAAADFVAHSWSWLLLAGLLFVAAWWGWRSLAGRRKDQAPSSPTSGATIFVSYARRDLESIRPIVTALTGKGFNVWIDVQGIEGASQWTAEIAQAIQQCRALLLMATPASMQSKFVARELLFAQEEGKSIVPVWFTGAEAPSAFRLVLADIQRIEATGDSADTVEKIVRALAKLGVPSTSPRNDPSPEVATG